MGYDVDNWSSDPHFQPATDLFEWAPKLHRGDETPVLDTKPLTTASLSEVQSLVSAAVTGQSAFATAMTSKWPTWWASLSSARQADLRAYVLKLRAAFG